MQAKSRSLVVAAVLVLGAGVAAKADQQQLAPGTARQDSVVIDSGPNGLCETTASAGDIQLGAVGQGSPNQNEIRCGANKIVDTAAQGDDVQLIAFGAACRNTNSAIVDTGANGIPETVLAGDDTYVGGIVLGTPPANAPCVITGQDGVAQTAAATADDTQVLAAGMAEANTDVLLCGPNGLADTAANNVGAGDDVQLVPKGNSCSAGTVIVDSGADGIATTRAEGPDLRISVIKSARITIPKGDASRSRLVKFKVSNVEFGASAPVSRSYRLATTAGSCGRSVATQIDADTATPGLQATAAVPLGGTVSASITVRMQLQDVTTPDKKNPYRCTFDVSAVALDTDPEVDDGANPEGNTATIDVEVVDGNDY